MKLPHSLSHPSSTYVCTLGQNCLVNLYLMERLRQDPSIGCVGLEDLMESALSVTNLVIFLLDISDMAVPLTKCIQTLGKRFSSGRFLIVSKGLSADQISGLLALGVDGFMEYEDVQEHLTTAIHEINAGSTWCSPALAKVERSVLMDLARKHNRDRSVLTCREFDIVQLVRNRMTNKEVACLLGIEESTVKFHLGNIFGKLNISTRDQLLEPARTNQSLLNFLSGDHPELPCPRI
jgi:DNA-binding NarL/FixJ family response regulator